MLLLLSLACSDYDVTRRVNVDVFNQGQGDVPADVLWVVDDSASMREEQETVAAHVDAFTDAILLSGIDFRIGVATTDITEGAALVGDVLTADSPSLGDALLAQMLVGTTGDREEAPLEAIRQVTAGGALAREEARLYAIVLSDEDDHSPDPVAAYLAALEDREGAGNYRVSAIAGGLPEGCASPAAQAEAGARLYEAAQASGGLFGSICATTFDEFLTSMGLHAAGMVDRFELLAIPSIDSIEVRVEGVLVHPRPVDGWQYDPGDNAVVFTGYAIPRPGETVEVRYYDYLGSAPEAGG